MREFLDLLGVQVVAEGPERHAYIGIFDGPRGRQPIPLSALSLIRYEEFQLAVLAGTGLLYRHHVAEGMWPPV